MDIIKAIRADLQLVNHSIDCYEFPSREKRIGIGGASLAIERNINYLGRLHKSGSKVLKDLQDVGYTGYMVEAQVNTDRGATRVKTISTRDFTKLITWDAIANRNKASIILLASFAETGLDLILDNLFKGISNQALLDKIVHYTKWTNDDLQMALIANYDDWQLIEEQEKFLAIG
jgi:hypothetical protein